MMSTDGQATIRRSVKGKTGWVAYGVGDEWAGKGEVAQSGKTSSGGALQGGYRRGEIKGYRANYRDDV